MKRRRACGILACVAAAAVIAAAPALAQPNAPPRAQAKPAPPAANANSGPPNAVQGFSQNRGRPVHIESARLEVRDKEKMATFIGSVQVIQGDTEMRCKTLVVHYEPDEAGPNASANEPKPKAEVPGAGGEQRINRMIARGDVVISQKGQIATGDSALFDLKTNVVTMTGNVVVTQGQSVLRGDRLVVDMTTGFSRVESGKNGQGRVQGLFLPGSNGGGLAPPALGGQGNDNAARPPARTAPPAPRY